MTPWMETRLRRKLYEAAVNVYLWKIEVAKAQDELDRVYREVERRGRWNQKRRKT